MQYTRTASQHFIIAACQPYIVLLVTPYHSLNLVLLLPHLYLQIAGAMITPMSVLFMIYSLYMYKMRSIQIMRRETVRYDDQRGPVVLTLLLIACVIVSLTLELITFDKGGEGGAPAAPSPIVGG